MTIALHVSFSAQQISQVLIKTHSFQTYTIWLIVETAGEGGFGWSKAQGLETSMEFDYLEGSYAWTVPQNLTSQYVDISLLSFLDIVGFTVFAD